MKLEQFIEQLKAMLKNPNALVLKGSVVYMHTNGGKLMAFDLQSTN